jgi:hypothetical protein
LIAIYAIAAGLTAVAVWGNNGVTRRRTSDAEAAAINVLWHASAAIRSPCATRRDAR